MLFRCHISTRFSSSSSGNIFSTSLLGIKVQLRRLKSVFIWAKGLLLSLENHIMVKSWLGPRQMESVGSCARNYLWFACPCGQYVCWTLELLLSINFPICSFFLGSLLDPLPQIYGMTASLILYYGIIQNRLVKQICRNLKTRSLYF